MLIIRITTGLILYVLISSSNLLLQLSCLTRTSLQDGQFSYPSASPLFHVGLIGRKSGALRWLPPCRFLSREVFPFKTTGGGGGRAGVVSSPVLSPIHFQLSNVASINLMSRLESWFDLYVNWEILSKEAGRDAQSDSIKSIETTPSVTTEFRDGIRPIVSSAKHRKEPIYRVSGPILPKR